MTNSPPMTSAPSCDTAVPTTPAAPRSHEACVRFVEALGSMAALPDVFNPWRDVDAAHDADEAAAGHRREHLLRYLSERVERARLVLVGEAPGLRTSL